VLPGAELRRVVDRNGNPVPAPASGLVLSSVLARVLGVHAGDFLTVEVLEGTQPIRRVLVSGEVDDILGVSAYMSLDALHDLMREAQTLSGASLLVDATAEDELAGRFKQMPAVAGVAFKSTVIENFRTTMAQNMGLMISINVLFAGIIAFGVVYNAARVSLSERSRELASLRVLGFTRAEISLILLGELALLTVLALPAGAAIGYGLAVAIVAGFESEVYRFPLLVTWSAVARSALVVVAASLISGLVVRRRLDRLDLVGTLKIRE
jgi:putative ABC transport system permease protein